MKSYKLHNQEYCGQTIQQIIGTDDFGVKYWIPKNEANTDYQEYLEWVSEGNTPEEAD
jgi:hypothetical protein